MFDRLQYHRKGIALIVGFALLLGLLLLVTFGNPAVTFSDANLEQAVRVELERPDGKLNQSDLLKLSSLDASGLLISSLEGLEHARNLESLDLEGNMLSDIAPLAYLKQLKLLNLRQNQVSDLSPLATLDQLESLDLNGNQVRDLEPLIGLTLLVSLNLRENQLTDLSPLAGLTQLNYLNLHSNIQINSVVPLAGLVNLETLILRNVPVGDEVAFLSQMIRLQRLNLRNCGIRDTQVLADLMAEGAIQDDPARGITAEINLLENNFNDHQEDPVGPLRPYWDNISDRQPLELPVVGSTIAPPVFSHAGGFFFEPLELALSTSDPKLTIYYTLDGSLPNLNSQRYTQPIQIAYRSGEPASLAYIPTAAGWQKPQGEVFQVTVIRAAAFSPQGLRSPVISETFIVDEQGADRFSLPLLSLVLEPRYLFDEEIGLYTDDLASETGLSWERPAHLAFYEPDGSPGFSQEIGVRIHGGWTRGLPQKSLRLYARPEYDPAGAFDYPIFPGLEASGSGKPLTTFNSLILRNSGNDWNSTMLRDAFLQSLVSHLDTFETQAWRPAILLINGEYWGIHHIRERYDLDYFRHHFDLKPDELALLSNHAELKEGTLEDRIAYMQLHHFVAGHDLADDDHFALVAAQVDLESLVDYYTAQIYFGNHDWPHNNIDFWRVQESAASADADADADALYRDGRWRWLLYDTDHGFGLYGEPAGEAFDHFRSRYGPLSGSQANSLMWAISQSSVAIQYDWPNRLIHHLLANETFRRQFILAMADALNSHFLPERVLTQLEEVAAILEPEMDEHIRRWPSIPSLTAWQQNLDSLRTFALKRPEALRQYYQQAFDLPGTARLTIETDPEQGIVQVNSLVIEAGTPGVADPASWSGIYFQEIPITLTAVAKPGYRFAGWEGIEAGEDEESIRLVPMGDRIVRARFRPAE